MVKMVSSPAEANVPAGLSSLREIDSRTSAIPAKMNNNKNKKAGGSKKPSPEEIEALRAASQVRKQAKREAEAQQQEKWNVLAEGALPDDGGVAMATGKDGKELFVPRSWREVGSKRNANEVEVQSRIRVVSWKSVGHLSFAGRLE